MDQVFPTIGSISRQMLSNFTVRERGDGERFWDLREDVDWQHSIVMDAYGRRILSADAYATVVKLLVEIYIASNSEEALEFLNDIEPYREIEELTGWLHAADSNLDYLTRVMLKRQYFDAEEALSDAHCLFLQEIGKNLITAIEEHVKELNATTALVN
ncbi:MAG: hypothetical protein AAFP70_08380 [Calditrichota bacterium]